MIARAFSPWQRAPTRSATTGCIICAWDSAPLEAILWQQADDLVGGDKAWLIIDDTALPKKGNASVGVAPQYASTLGKNANCQTLVSVTLASGEVPLMLSLRLFLPESWTSNEARMIKVGVQLVFPVAARGRPRLHHVPNVKSRPAQAMLEGAKWRQVSWRRGTKGRLVARFAAVRVRIADGTPQRINNSRKNSASTILKGAPGSACIATRS